MGDFMELAAKYAYKVWEKKSFSAAAKDLYISQPALSSMIMRLESELGFKIFDRSTVPLSLTPHGVIYIDTITEIIESENNMLQRIRALEDMTYGSISIGTPMYASYRILPVICKEFYRLYPEIAVTIDVGSIGGIEELFKKLKNNTIDLVLTYDYSSDEFEAIPLLEERLVIVMSRDMAGAEKFKSLSISRDDIVSRKYTKSQLVHDMSIFEGIYFIKNRGSYNISQKMSQILVNYNVSPYSITNSKQFGMDYSIMQTGIGAVMISDLYIASTPDKSNNLLYFVPDSPHAKRTLYLVKRKEPTENIAAKNFVSIATALSKNGGLFPSTK